VVSVKEKAWQRLCQVRIKEIALFLKQNNVKKYAQLLLQIKEEPIGVSENHYAYQHSQWID